MLEKLLEAHRDQVSPDNWELFRAGYAACYTDLYKQSKKVVSSDGHTWSDHIASNGEYCAPVVEAYVVGQKPIEPKAMLVDDECQ